MSGRHTFREAVRYKLDNLISKSPVWQILALAVFSALIVVIGTLAVSSAAPEDLQLDGERGGVVHRAWWAFTRLVDPGTFADDDTTPWIAISGVMVTLGGILVFSLLIGILSSKIGEKLDELKRGKSAVIEDEHSIIVGAGDKLFEIVRELVEAFAHMPDNVVAIFSPAAKEEMDETLKERIPDTGTTKVVCRTGCPTDLDALRKMGFARAKSFLVIGDHDEEVVKTLLAVWSLTSERPLRAVCEISDRRMFDIADMAYPGVRCVPVAEIVMRLMVQVCRQPGLSAVYSEILSFSGNELYFIDAPGVAGKTFAEACFMVRAGSVVGVSREGRMMISPDPGTALQNGDRLLVLTDNYESCNVEDTPDEDCSEIAYSPTGRDGAEPEQILVLSGESRKVSFMLGLLDSYVEPGSSVTVAGSLAAAEAQEFLPAAESLSNITVHYRRVDRTRYQQIKALEPEGFGSILVLSGQGAVRDDEEADSRCIVTLLILRKILEEVALEREPIIVSEIKNPRNRKLASAAKIDDFIVSNEVTSMVMAQLSVEPALWEVYSEIFDPRGCEVQMREFELYCPAGESIAFCELMKMGLRRRETVLGYLVRGQDRDDRVVLNPPRDEVITPGPRDMVVVVAER
jgi:Trk K+ transport system NAD-binding subunit